MTILESVPLVSNVLLFLACNQAAAEVRLGDREENRD
jgi:hypothetical protein